MYRSPIFGLVSLLFASCFVMEANGQQQKDCETIEVKAEVVKPSSDSLGSIKLTFSKSRPDDYTIILTGVNYPGTIARKGVSEFHDLSPGLYDIYLVDRKGCSKQLNIHVNLSANAEND